MRSSSRPDLPSDSRALADPDSKRAYNRALFERVAPRYDFVTRALSLGRDQAWKRRLIAGLPARAAPACLDLACGTGDLTERLARRYGDGHVTGIDLTPEMLDLARARNPADSEPGRRMTFIQGDMGRLEIPDSRIDIVTGGYALRNAPDLDRALAEIARVLRPGGVAAFLDFSKPPGRALAAAQGGAMEMWGALWGLVLHGKPAVYAYIARSLRGFPDRVALRERCAAAGLRWTGEQSAYGGLLQSFYLHKPEDDAA